MLKFRNLNTLPEAPVEEWPTEAVLTALERGSLRDWRRLVRNVSQNPWGPTARKVEQALAISHPFGVAELMERALARARKRVAGEERKEIGRQVQRLLDRSGLSRSEFARRIGTSPSRLSTYLNAKVTPSAALLLRMERLAGKRQ